MVLIKHNFLKSDIFFNPIFIPGFSRSRFFKVQVFQGPGPGSGSRVQGPGPGSRVRVQVLEVTHPALRRHGDVAVTSLSTSQRRRRYVSNETPNDVSMELRQDVSVVRLHDVLFGTS